MKPSSIIVGVARSISVSTVRLAHVRFQRASIDAREHRALPEQRYPARAGDACESAGHEALSSRRSGRILR